MPDNDYATRALARDWSAGEGGVDRRRMGEGLKDMWAEAEAHMGTAGTFTTSPKQLTLLKQIPSQRGFRSDIEGETVKRGGWDLGNLSDSGAWNYFAEWYDDYVQTAIEKPLQDLTGGSPGILPTGDYAGLREMTGEEKRIIGSAPGMDYSTGSGKVGKGWVPKEFSASGIEGELITHQAELGAIEDLKTEATDRISDFEEEIETAEENIEGLEGDIRDVKRTYDVGRAGLADERIESVRGSQLTSQQVQAAQAQSGYEYSAPIQRAGDIALDTRDLSDIQTTEMQARREYEGAVGGLKQDIGVQKEDILDFEEDIKKEEDLLVDYGDDILAEKARYMGQVESILDTSATTALTNLEGDLQAILKPHTGMQMIHNIPSFGRRHISEKSGYPFFKESKGAMPDWYFGDKRITDAALQLQKLSEAATGTIMDYSSQLGQEG
tara:strand:+ start:1369 stop:2685 length:1317 start_codon:yes stop_codon:yes gene_type:complete